MRRVTAGAVLFHATSNRRSKLSYSSGIFVLSVLMSQRLFIRQKNLRLFDRRDLD
ncbi:hypothetical protein TK11N_05090 [Tetragenococcus koreensis]|uniref:Uncharacterized protein n=1 Tax=Tetragenococcus koreensis TaxID=290335 RepID=A0AAN4UAG6_9ENTE|nr:hypothetical protein TK11N_05090 [Tetragenococcus koreensis]GEQ51086.1 hypothetical protein TK12N_04300 [Tetragenococcus koreensis]GEQ53665.1 hypothetical protein TK2N_05090 [Tetragenococcus koreensis]GEQ56000.1 hypothetical protein TK4N_03430 [Tetragenococcus koreensis]GEQ58670.1 hypothetical protein TK6N_05090 [Tetragenococcus koreensis]